MFPIHHYDLEYVEVFVFETFIITQIRESFILQPEHNQQLREIILKHFASKNLVYIANRVNAYNVSPMTYMETSKIENLLGMCIVTIEGLAQETAHFESKFYSKKFHVTDNLLEAMVWSDELVHAAALGTM